MNYQQQNYQQFSYNWAKINVQKILFNYLKLNCILINDLILNIFNDILILLEMYTNITYTTFIISLNLYKFENSSLL